MTIKHNTLNDTIILTDLKFLWMTWEIFQNLSEPMDYLISIIFFLKCSKKNAQEIGLALYYCPVRFFFESSQIPAFCHLVSFNNKKKKSLI